MGRALGEGENTGWWTGARGGQGRALRQGSLKGLLLRRTGIQQSNYALLPPFPTGGKHFGGPSALAPLHSAQLRGHDARGHTTPPKKSQAAWELGAGGEANALRQHSEIRVETGRLGESADTHVSGPQFSSASHPVKES